MTLSLTNWLSCTPPSRQRTRRCRYRRSSSGSTRGTSPARSFGLRPAALARTRTTTVPPRCASVPTTVMMSFLMIRSLTNIRGHRNNLGGKPQFAEVVASLRRILVSLNATVVPPYAAVKAASAGQLCQAYKRRGSRDGWPYFGPWKADDDDHDDHDACPPARAQRHTSVFSYQIEAQV